MGIDLEDALFDARALKALWKPTVRRAVTGSWRPLVMQPAEAPFPPGLRRIGLYLHVPFCRNLCPYCPYNRVEYDERLYDAYEAAVHQEIDLRADQVRRAGAPAGRPMPRVTSLYVGGGTPTVRPAGLSRMVRHLREAFQCDGDACVELHPAAMDDECLDILKDCGVTMLSVGVESVRDGQLERIGRSHDAATAEDAVRRAVRAGFASVNADLMFALPGQTADDLAAEVEQVLALGVDQLSTYPIFGFPYTELGRELGIEGIKRPDGLLVRRMLAVIRERCEAAGMEQCAVWSFLRPGRKKFSSITRHHYLGFGPSAASMTGDHFAVNTFCVEQYAATLPATLPVALALPMSRRLEMAYWLYWRLYEMAVPLHEFEEVFGKSLPDAFGALLKGPMTLGMMERCNGSYRVTPEGAYWIHRLQNEYSLNFINRLWGRCREEAWPREVRL